MSWMEDVVKLSGGEIIAIDGKTHRRSHDLRLVHPCAFERRSEDIVARLETVLDEVLRALIRMIAGARPATALPELAACNAGGGGPC